MTQYHPDMYEEKKATIEEAFCLIKSGQRIFIGSSCGEPQHLVKGLVQASPNFNDLEIIKVLSIENSPLNIIANKTDDTALNIRSFYNGSCASPYLSKNKRFTTPVNISSIPLLFKSRKLPINVALIQVSPPDAQGKMSLGISVDVTLAAAISADIVIVQVNPNMPRLYGESCIGVEDVHAIVEYEEPLLTLGSYPDLESADVIAEHIERVVDDGSTMQIGLGAIPKAVISALSDKNDLGIHTHYLTDTILQLISKGVVTNREKGIHKGKSLAAAAIGTEELYKYLHQNPDIHFYPSDYIDNPSVIAKNSKMTSINVAVAMDLTGQVAVDAFSYNNFCGINSVLDFIRGAAMSPQGKPIIMLTSTAANGKKSRIVPLLNEMIVVPRTDVFYVVTEYGAVNLFGKSLQERAIAMISLAHPDFRDELFDNAKQLGLLSAQRSSYRLTKGVYPVELEENITIDDTQVTIRPSKPVDERRIQEHFYNLDIEDVVARFFHKKTKFIKDEIKDISQIDYKNELSIIAVVGEFGFGRVVGIGEYFFEPKANMAEIAFSVSREFQGKGLGTILIKKLAQEAKKNNIGGLFAYTSPDNKAMICLFNKLSSNSKESFDKGILKLEFNFKEK